MGYYKYTVYDFECYSPHKHNTFVCFITYEYGKLPVVNVGFPLGCDYDLPYNILSGISEIKTFVQNIFDEKQILVGHNTHHYDDIMLLAIIFDNQVPYEINKKIINGHLLSYKINETLSVDTYKGCVKDQSLKMFEAHIGAGIRESKTGFNLKEDLTYEELVGPEGELEYCLADVRQTNIFFNFRLEYFKTSMMVMTNYGNDLKFEYAIKYTNAQLAGKVLNTKRSDPKINNSVLYTKRDYILDGLIETPPQVINFYKKHWNKFAESNCQHNQYNFTNLAFDPQLGNFMEFNQNNKDTILHKYCRETGCDMLILYTWGGTHSKNSIGVYENIVLKDVEAYYPNTYNNHELGPITEDPNILISLMKDSSRMKANKDPGRPGVKLVTNIVFGAQGDPTNQCYNPPNKIAICVYGQIMLNELALRLIYAGLKVININTDGVTLADIDTPEKEALHKSIGEQWSKDFNYNLEDDRFERWFQLNVNDYVTTNGDKIKFKGSFKKTKGINDKVSITSGGQYTNYTTNHMSFIDRCFTNYFLFDKPVRESLEELRAEQDVTAFQFLFKTGKASPLLAVNGKLEQTKVSAFFALKDSKDSYKKVTSDIIKSRLIIEDNNEEMIKLISNYKDPEELGYKFITNLKNTIKKAGDSTRKFVVLDDKLNPYDDFSKRSVTVDKFINLLGEDYVIGDSIPLLPSKVTSIRDKIMNVEFDPTLDNGAGLYKFTPTELGLDLLSRLDLDVYEQLVINKINDTIEKDRRIYHAN